MGENTECCHGHLNPLKGNPSQTDCDIKKIYKVFLLCGFFMVLEIWGHWTSNTISLLADSVHLLADMLGFIISLVALKWTKKKATKKMNFGYERVEIIGAMFSIFLIWMAVIYLLTESYHKYHNPHVIDTKIFFFISVVGFVVNIICAFSLHETHDHQGSNSNLNIRAAYIHVIGDVIQSLGVLIASIITYFNPHLVIADIICTVFFSIIVLFSTGVVLRDALLILSESAPADIDINELTQKLKEIENVYDVIDLRCWALCANSYVANVTLLIEDVFVMDYEVILAKSKKTFFEHYKFKYATIQVETFGSYYETKAIRVDESIIHVVN